MALATNTLVDGQWTTRNLDVNSVLQHYEQQDKEAARRRGDIKRAPVLGLLTQTAIRSPLVHWILPVKLRGQETNDVAFIGDDFVQIKELRLDGLLWEVIQKNNFGARIRNARIVGPTEASLQNDGNNSDTQLKQESDDASAKDQAPEGGNTSSQQNSPLPPQVILLQLDSGDSLFLMLRRNGTRGWEFVTSRHRVSRAMLMVQPGMHLAVNPSSRYAAVGCSEGVIAIYALNSREELERQHSCGQPLRYIESERHIYFHGVVHKMEFLYPAADDDKHIVLLVLVVWRGKTRMQLYEWVAGCDLREIRAHSRKGHQLEKSRQMPLLLIPLTIQSTFLLVYEDSMVMCKDILQGIPQFIDFGESEAATAMHHGSGPPLWTSWARPLRLPYHTVKQDDIYIVREDGFVKYLELQIAEDDIRDMNIGILDSNCGTALAYLDYQPPDADTGDMLVTGGDSCSGGTYVVLARQGPALRERIENWSPAQDIVTTSINQDRDVEDLNEKFSIRGYFPSPDRIFACVGKGTKGSITEFRYGLEARLGLETEFHTPVMDAWVAPSSLCSAKEDEGSFFLLSVISGSALLRLSSDASEIDEVDQASTLLDLRYRTIVANLRGDCATQVTEQSVVYVDGHKKRVFQGEEVLRIPADDFLGKDFVGCGSIIDDAVIHESIVIFTTHFQSETYLQVLDLKTSNNAESDEAVPGQEAESVVRHLMSCSTHITSLAVCMLKETLCVIVAEWTGSAVRLIFVPLSGGSTYYLFIPEEYEEQCIRLQAFTSISVRSAPAGYLALVCGTRAGVVTVLYIREQDLGIVNMWCARIGAASVMIKQHEGVGSDELLLLTCDSKLFTLKVPTGREVESGLEVFSDRRAINQVWLTDARNSRLQQPEVNAVATLLPNTYDETNTDILLISGSQLLLANLSTQSKPVPRNIPIRGTPTRLLYSRSLNAIIVAASVDGKCTLLFIDPDTGCDISKPVDKKGTPMDYVSGLGEEDEKIFRLIEWPFKKSGKTWYFIVLSTNTGRLLILSTETELENSHPTRMETDFSSESEEGSGSRPFRPKIRFWTRYKFKCPNPVYSVAVHEEGLVYCSGNTLYFDLLSLSEKKFETAARYTLPSPAVDLAFEDEKIYATTASHSLEVLELIDQDDGTWNIVHTHGDQVTRNALHHRLMGYPPGPFLNLISDKSCTVSGLWPTRGTRADTLENVFEAHISHSILRFRSGNCRPLWDTTWDPPIIEPNLEIVPNSAEYPEVFGLSIDGSLYHFTILNFASWRFLRFIVDLAKQSPKICEFTCTQGTVAMETGTSPKTMMHIDGDILHRIEAGDLEQLLRIGEDSADARQIQSLFRELLWGLRGDILDEDAEMSVYLKRAYKDLDFFLRPVL